MNDSLSYLGNNKGDKYYMGKKVTLSTVLLAIGFAPLVISSIVLCYATTTIVSNNSTDAVYDKLTATAMGLKQYYQYDVVNGNEIQYEHDYVDMLKNDGIDMTVFIGDTRLMTSTVKEDGSRNEGTKMDPAIWSRVQKGEIVHAGNVKVGVDKYFVCYVPIMNADHEVIGAAWAGESMGAVKSHTNYVTFIILLTVGISIVIFALIIIIFARRVTSPITVIVDGIQMLAKGDLNTKVEVNSFVKEIQGISDNCDTLQTEMRDVITQAKEVANTTSDEATNLATTASQMSDTSDNVSTAVQDMSSVISDQANSIQDTMASINNLSDAIQTVANNAETLASTAANMDTASSSSKQALQMLQDNMQTIEQAIKNIEIAMSATNNSVSTVNSKVEGIKNIASQTNLLALNASIEAARAGEQGKGFAVVAEEIGKLAAESADTATEINDEMNQLLINASEATAKTNEMSELGHEVIKVLHTTVENINSLIADISKTVDGVSNISALTEECNANKDHIVDAMSSLSAISEQNAASTAETSAAMESLNATISGLANSAENLNTLSVKLLDTFDYFK